MKTKKALIIVICILIFSIGLRTAILYFGNMYPNKSYFEDEYVQIIYPTSISDYITAKSVMKTADEAFSTITTYEDAELKFGELGRYCVTDDDAVNEKHSLHFVSANFEENEGYIWIKYTCEAYNENDITSGSWNILSRWELEKADDEWTVVSISEHP